LTIKELIQLLFIEPLHVENNNSKLVFELVNDNWTYDIITENDIHVHHHIHVPIHSNDVSVCNY